MKYEKYISLIKNLENTAKTNPSTYRFQVFLIALVGYAYFALVISIPLILVVGIAAFLIFKPGGLILLLKILGKVIWLLAVVAFGAISSFWGAIKAMLTRVDPPEGYELQSSEGPKLFADVIEAGKFLNAPKPDHILITADFNAAIVNLPQRGIFGNRSYLCLGLPLMETLSPEQLKAVIAHEMGHFSGKHGKGDRWIYQMRESWSRFLENQEAQDTSSIKFLYEPFLNWYFPYFNAHSFVLARQQEREADNLASQITGAKPLAEALITLEVKSRILEQSYWKEIFEQSKLSENPPGKVFSKMFKALRQQKEEAQETLTLRQALAVRTDYSNTHPALSERLKFLGFDYNERDLELPKTEQESAARFYLESLAETLTERFDAEWQASVSEAWKAQHKYFKEVEKRLGELEKKSQAETLTDEELYELAGLTADKHEGKAALPIINELLQRNPDFAPARYTLGMMLLDEEDERGIQELEKAQSTDPSLAVPALERIYSFLFAKGRDDEALAYLKRIEEFYEKVALAERERNSIADHDRLKPHNVPDETVEKIKMILSHHEEITAAYLVEKDVKYFPESPCFILGLKIKKKWFWNRSALKDTDLVEIIAGRVGEMGIHYVLTLNKFKSLEKQIKNIPQSLIYNA